MAPTPGVRDVEHGWQMSDNLEQQISNRKKRIQTVRILIEEQWADGLPTDAAERVLGEELSWLKSLVEKLATGESTSDN
jgi:hypothetical protein